LDARPPPRGYGRHERAGILSPNGFVYGSIRGILLHTLAGEVIWLARWQGESPNVLLSEADVATLPGLVRRWRRQEDEMRFFLAELTPERLASNLPYRSTRGGDWAEPLWQQMAHILNHGTQHRSEAAEALTLIGRSPGDLDLIDFFRERGR